ncbi:unnamed protein product, partial [Mesorhabditis belari]|uniref:C-type lectin domain-containing protein n=1 Tax=Mesorhabditis belari TaxID=2138241 RepID=A0AAF3EIB1_9BILA
MAVSRFITILLLFHQISSSIQQSDQLDQFTSPNDRAEIPSRDGWLYFAKTASWYKAIDQEMEFDKAEEYCVEQMGHLVSIHSQEENDLVQKLAKTVHSHSLFSIGMKRNPNNENSLEWIDGSSVDFTNWIGGKPKLETHAMLWGGDGRWSVFFPWGLSVPFICKRSSEF